MHKMVVSLLEFFMRIFKYDVRPVYHIDKDYINCYNDNELSKLKELISIRDNFQNEVDRTQNDIDELIEKARKIQLKE